MKITTLTLVLIAIPIILLGQKTEFFKDQNLWKETKENRAKFKKVTSQNGDTTVVVASQVDPAQTLFVKKYIKKKPVGVWKFYDLKGAVIKTQDFNAMVYDEPASPVAEPCENGCQQAEFPGGEDGLFQFLATHVEYPNYSKDIGHSGTAFVQVLVDESGHPSPVYIMQGIDPYIDQECWSTVEEMPKWKPAMKNGKPVRSLYKIPFTFKLL